MVIVKDASGNEQELGRLGSFDTTRLTDAAGKFSLKIDDLDSGAESAANLVFRDQGTFGMRFWVRFASTVVPIVLLLLSLYTQRKKFFIDEDYYDQMMTEINSRKEEESSLA